MHTFLADFVLALRGWARSWSFILSNGLAHYFLYPVILSIGLGMGVFALLKEITDLVTAPIADYFSLAPLPATSGWPGWRELLHNIAVYGSHVLLWIVGLVTTLKLLKYLVLILMSPVMALLSERTEEILTGKKLPFSLWQLVTDSLRGTALAIRNLLLELAITWGLGLFSFMGALFFLPIGALISAVCAVLIMLVGAYFYGFSTLDYINERRRLPVQESIHRIRQWRGLAVGNGMVFSLLMRVPVVGITAATITCTVAAVLSIHERENLANHTADDGRP